MNIYIFCATESEVAAAHSFCVENLVAATEKHHLNFGTFITKNNNTINFVCHGVGAAFAQLCIQDIALTGSPNLLLQAGIAGVYTDKGTVENVYCVSADRFADVGAEDEERFLSIEDLQLQQAAHKYGSNGWLLNVQQPYPAFFAGLPQAKGITVNTTSGSEITIRRWEKLYRPHTESMEGAALHLVGLAYNIPFVQLRAISNYVQVRDKSKWKIAGAIAQLNATLIEYIQSL
jgi:futalosine hydrolase